jgi:hypothetical protein
VGNQPGVTDQTDPRAPGEIADRIKTEVRQSRELASRLADVEDHLADVEEHVAETFDQLAASPRGRERHAKVAAEAREGAETARRAAQEGRRLSNDQTSTAMPSG